MSYITKQVKAFVTERANEKCEYCLINFRFSYFPFHIEHIISIKHGVKSSQDNLALACPICNLNKGTDLGSLNNSNILIRFFNPRTDIWEEHFELDSTGEILANTEVGNVTLKIFKMNHPESLIERKELIKYKLI